MDEAIAKALRGQLLENPKRSAAHLLCHVNLEGEFLVVCQAEDYYKTSAGNY